MRVSSSIQARAGLLPTSSRQAGPLPGVASDLGVLQQLGELRAPRLLSKRKGPSIHTTTQAVPGNLKFTTRFGAGEAVPCSVIQKAVAATCARHTSRRTPLHLESLAHWHGFISWVMDSHIRQLHLTRGQKAQAGFRCVPTFLLSSINAHGSLREGLFCFPPVVSLMYDWTPMCWHECRNLGSCDRGCLSV